jgi:hypothetical protein
LVALFELVGLAVSRVRPKAGIILKKGKTHETNGIIFFTVVGTFYLSGFGVWGRRH